MRRMIVWLMVIGILISCTSPVYGQETDQILNEQLETLDLSSVNAAIQKLRIDMDNPYLDEFNLYDIVVKTARGEMEFSLQTILDQMVKGIWKEVYIHFYLIQRLIVTAVLCAILKNLNTSFQGKSVGEVGFYVCYIVLIILLFQSFQVAIDLTRETIDALVLIMQAFLPTLMTLMISSGNITSATVFHPVVLFATQVISVLIRDLFLPMIFFTAVLQIVNHLTDKQVLKQLIDLFKSIINWGLKGIAGIFISALTLQGLTSPVVDGVVNKTAKFAVGTIPVVGDVLTGAVDTVLNWSILIKNGVALGGVVIVALVCLVPILKLIALILVYKCTAAIVQPISEDRVVKCMDQIGSFCSLLLGSMATVAIMFIFSIVMMIGMSNITTMIR